MGPGGRCLTSDWRCVPVYFVAFCLPRQVFIKSTAGMRLLPDETQEAIYSEIYSALGEYPADFRPTGGRSSSVEQMKT